MADDKVCCIKRYYGLCPDHGMDEAVHASLVETSKKYYDIALIADEMHDMLGCFLDSAVGIDSPSFSRNKREIRNNMQKLFSAYSSAKVKSHG